MKQKVPWAAGAAFLVLLTALGAFALHLAGSGAPGSARGERIGLMNREESEQAPFVTAEERSAARESREPFTEGSVAQFEEKTLAMFSGGRFEALDEWLRELQEHYRDAYEEEQLGGISYETKIERLRADLALLAPILEKGASKGGETGFQTPEAAAAAVVYAPISWKAEHLIHQDAALLPAVAIGKAESVCMTRQELTPRETLARLEELNARQTGANRFSDLQCFRFSAYGYECAATVVRDERGWYRPYSVAAEPAEGGLLTVRDVNAICAERAAAGLDFDPDMLVAGVIDAEAASAGEGVSIPAEFEIPEGYTPPGTYGDDYGRSRTDIAQAPPR